MPTPICAKCRRVIPPQEINVANDVAYCRDCNISFRLSELTEESGIGASTDLMNPPAGAWFRNDGAVMAAGATNRSLAAAAGMLFFALFWNGIVSIFVLFAITGTLHHFGIRKPDWLPAPQTKGGGDMPFGMVLFLWLFLTPFILIGITAAATCLNCLFGRTEVNVMGAQGTVFNGIGPVGRRKRFDASQIGRVRILETTGNRGGVTRQIVIESRVGKEIKFGTILSNERRVFLLAALRKTLVR